MADDDKKKPVVAIRMQEDYEHEFQFNQQQLSVRVRAGERLTIDRSGGHRFPIRRLDNSIAADLAEKLVSDGKAKELRG